VTGVPCDPAELSTLFLFEKLAPEQLDWLCAVGHVESLPAGPIFREGEEARCFYVLLDGEIVMSRRVGDEDVEVTRTSARGVYSGAFQAYLGDRVPQVYANSVRALVPSRFFVLSAERFAELMRDWFPMAQHLLEGLFFGIKNINQAVGQRERLLALGSLSAGLTHELNNPAAAAVRATATLRESVARVRTDWTGVVAACHDPEALNVLLARQRDAVTVLRRTQGGPGSPGGSALETSDLEDEVSDWLTEHAVADGWDLAATFVQAGLDTAWLEHLAAEIKPAALPAVVRWLGGTVEVELLLDEIDDSTARISKLVKAAKAYSQMDRGPYQVVVVHDLLISTLMMMAGNFGPGVHVVKDFDTTLPRIPAYAAELNQVWTNLIDNAVAAMQGEGTLTLRTRRDESRLIVEIGDTGPGIPPELQERVFQPFFTTKPVGEGTGLGLDISWRVVVNRHHGDLSVESVPGDTRFRVALPLDPAPGAEMLDAAPEARPDAKEQG
jgi:signal transduction histidine kinase